MPEDVNYRIIKKIKESDKADKQKKFLIDLIREEFARSSSTHWRYQDFYKEKIEEYLSK
jgi:hypothetical protein